MTDPGQTRRETQEGNLVFGRLRVRSLAELLDAPPRDYLIKGLLSPGEMSIVAGHPKSGKSFFMLHIAYAIAQGRSIFGWKVKEEPMPVLYVAAEGAPGLANRLKALQLRYGGTGNFYLIAQSVNLLHEHVDLPALVSAAQCIGAKLIVIDTLSRAIAGGDENGPKDMGTFVANITKLREETGAHTTIVHHGSKDRDPWRRSGSGAASRGHGSLEGAADIVIEVASAKKNGAHSVTVMMAKDDPDGSTVNFSLQVVELKNDSAGGPITTCLIEEFNIPARPIKPKLSEAEMKSCGLLKNLLEKHGELLPEGSIYPVGSRGVSGSRWQEACLNGGITEAKALKDRTKVVSRIFAALHQKGFVAGDGHLVWLL